MCGDPALTHPLRGAFASIGTLSQKILDTVLLKMWTHVTPTQTRHFIVSPSEKKTKENYISEDV